MVLLIKSFCSFSSHGYDIRAKPSFNMDNIEDCFSSHGYDIRAKLVVSKSANNFSFSSHGYDIRAKQASAET